MVKRDDKFFLGLVLFVVGIINYFRFPDTNTQIYALMTIIGIALAIKFNVKKHIKNHR